MVVYYSHVKKNYPNCIQIVHNGFIQKWFYTIEYKLYTIIQYRRSMPIFKLAPYNITKCKNRSHSELKNAENGGFRLTFLKNAPTWTSANIFPLIVAPKRAYRRSCRSAPYDVNFERHFATLVASANLMSPTLPSVNVFLDLE